MLQTGFWRFSSEALLSRAYNHRSFMLKHLLQNNKMTQRTLT